MRSREPLNSTVEPTTWSQAAFDSLMRGWLAKHDLPIDRLIVRSDGDTRRDSLVKAEIHREPIERFFDVRYVVDDRPQVVDAWRALGLPVLQVTDPGIVPPIAEQLQVPTAPRLYPGGCPRRGRGPGADRAEPVTGLGFAHAAFDEGPCGGCRRPAVQGVRGRRALRPHEGKLAAPETAHAIRATIDEARAAKETGEERVILFNYSGHGFLDLTDYDDHNQGRLVDE